MQPLIRRVQYYETDKMGITHHANYIHWMEEARISLLEQLGYPYDRMEREEIFVPVTGIQFDYKASTTFPDEISIDVQVDSFDGVTLTLRYEMTRISDDKLIGIGNTKHVFLNKAGRFIRLKRDYPELYAVLVSLQAGQNT